MKHILIQPDFADWRTHARTALQEGYTPEDLDLEDATVNTPLALDLLTPDDRPTGSPVLSPHVPKHFLELAEIAAVHRDPRPLEPPLSPALPPPDQPRPAPHRDRH